MTPIKISETRRANFLAEAQKFWPQGPNWLAEMIGVAPKLAEPLSILEPVLKRDLAKKGYAIAYGLPIDPVLPDPPTNGKRPSNKTWVTESTLVSISYLLNTLPVGYVQECPELFTQVAPQKGKELALSSGGSLKPLGFHSDNAILLRQYRPEFLSLIGLINESETPTYIAHIEDALNHLSLRQQKILFDDCFRIQLPPSFCLYGGKELYSEPRPIVRETSRGIEFAANLYATKALNPEAEAAKSALGEVLAKIAAPVVITPGSLLVFDNHKIVHGRAAISTGKRWLQRLFSRRDLTAIRQATNTDEQTFTFDIAKIVLE